MDYKKILEGVVDIINTTENSDIGFANICSYIGENCPELKESDDERIRKCIGDVVREHDWSHIFGVTKDDCLSWLEKQGKQKPYGKRKKCSDCQFNYSGECKGSCQMKKDEQKLADKVEPKFKVKYAGSEYNVFETKNIAGIPFYGIEDEPNHIDYVQAENCEIINGGYGIKEGGFSIPTKPAMFSEQKSADKVEDEEYNGEDYGIDSLFHAQRILEKTLGKVDGYQTDDGILAHQCAISAAKKLYEQKPTYDEMKELLQTEYEKGRADAISEMKNPAWSEEDEEMFEKILQQFTTANNDCKLHNASFTYDKEISFLKSLKNRVQPKQEWSKEDIRNIDDIDSILFYDKDLPEDTCMRLRNWLKSLRPQNR